MGFVVTQLSFEFAMANFYKNKGIYESLFNKTVLR